MKKINSITYNYPALCRIVVLFMAINYNYATSQSFNLVPNSSFENYIVCPTYANAPPPPWYMPTTVGPIYKNKCSTDPLASVPQFIQWGSYQYPKSGNAYLVIDYGQPNNSNLRTYVQVKLLDSMVKSKRYYFEYFVNLPEGIMFACNNIAAILSKNAVFVDTINYQYGVLYSNSFIMAFANPVITDTINWVKISGIYNAKGGEQFLTLGNFQEDTGTLIKQVQSTGYYGAAYFLDDVSIIPLDSMCLKADAGKDTTINIGDSIFIGSYTNGIDTLKWLQNGAAIDSTRPGFWVKPTTGTSYILQQTINGCFSNDTVTITVNPLPLKFVSFAAQIQPTPNPSKEGNVLLKWQTANEINVSHFNIQRSINGKDFEVIGIVKANNNNYNEYSFIDDLKTKDQYPKTLYYRNQSIDKDGKISYSETKRIRLNQLTNKPINIYPNPTKGLVHISIPKEEKGIWNIKVQDATGRVLQTKTTSAITKTMDLLVSNQTGLYYITLENNTTNKKIVEKVVVE